jgi:hypothetical protein
MHMPYSFFGPIDVVLLMLNYYYTFSLLVTVTEKYIVEILNLKLIK